MTTRILLVNPPIYDFAAYDFWLKPYGLLTVAGQLRGKVDFVLFDYLDRLTPFATSQKKLQSDQWGRGRFYSEQIPSPQCLSKIPRRFRRFGSPSSLFQNFLSNHKPCDFVLIQTIMTYWYQGVYEVIADIRKAWPGAKIVIGGNYVTLCQAHAKKSGADFLVTGTNLKPLWKYLSLIPDPKQPGMWEVYNKLETGVLKLTDGCPFSCTYCTVSKVYDRFKARPLERALAELELLVKCGARNIAFYDDALLFKAEEILAPFLNEVLRRGIKVNFHCPNGLHARFINKEIAQLMTQAGFKTFYLGFESSSLEWQERTGPKVFCDELTNAVDHLISAGAEPSNITAYQILGHPHIDIQELEASMHFVNSLGISGMLADFSPIPGTPDGDYCKRWVDLDEPLFHNKAVFPVIMLGFDEVNRLKDLQRQLNGELSANH